MAYKVIQWATGSMGKSCLRATLDHPDLDLVGLLVYSESKIGRDAGEIARRDPTGVIATRSLEDIMAVEADVVIHAPRIQPPYSYHNKDICRLLASGIFSDREPEVRRAFAAAGLRVRHREQETDWVVLDLERPSR